MAGKRISTFKYHGFTVADLEKLHTGTLMNIRKAAYALSGSNCECCNEYHSDDPAYDNAQGQLLNNVLEVLKTRPHIPTKMERKAARQAAAKQGKRK